MSDHDPTTKPTPPIPETWRTNPALMKAIRDGNRDEAVRLANESADFYDKRFLAKDREAARLVGLKFKFLGFAEAMKTNAAYFEHVRKQAQ
jgi:hypothetical protein